MTTPGPQLPQPASTVPRPVWGADCPISMPLPAPASEARLIEMGGFSFTQYRLVHTITAAEYEELAVPVYAPATGQVVVDSQGIDQAGPPAGTP
jgi:hypothetical protein